jgi:hypothetical protein
VPTAVKMVSVTKVSETLWTKPISSPNPRDTIISENPENVTSGTPKSTQKSAMNQMKISNFFTSPEAPNSVVRSIDFGVSPVEKLLETQTLVKPKSKYFFFQCTSYLYWYKCIMLCVLYLCPEKYEI